VTNWRVPFTALAPGLDRADVQAAIDRVIASGWFVLGPEVDAFESEFAQATGATYAVGVASGTDAIALILRALDIGPGDEVITTSLSAAFTALAVAMVGARPVFADIDPVRLTIDPGHVSSLIGPRTRAVLPVHLYGQATDMTELARIAARRNIAIVEDCCQSHLATAAGRPVGTLGVAGAFSFYPTKNLGALGDGGAVVTNDAQLAARVKRLRNGGQRGRYEHEEAGVNSRLDELQAAILRARLPRLAGWTRRRRILAARYRDGLQGVTGIDVPREYDPGHVYHLFVIRVPRLETARAGEPRASLQASLGASGIETLIHYPTPIPAQKAFGSAGASQWPAAEAACSEVLSLPLHHHSSEADVDAVVASVQSASARTMRRA
jgi:dTDP-4-amino-4,6-dideoxygalactose transaminase